MTRPVRITEATLNDGLQIRKAPYRIKGIIHHRGQGDWSVSVKNANDWHRLGKDSASEIQTDREALLSGIVVIQLNRDSAVDCTTDRGCPSLHCFIYQSKYEI